jgi:hypothetical protein
MYGLCLMYSRVGDRNTEARNACFLDGWIGRYCTGHSLTLCVALKKVNGCDIGPPCQDAGLMSHSAFEANFCYKRMAGEIMVHSCGIMNCLLLVYNFPTPLYSTYIYITLSGLLHAVQNGSGELVGGAVATHVASADGTITC